MRRVQQGRQAIHRQYLKIRENFLRRNDLCQANITGICGYWSSDVHHITGRIGQALVDENYFLAVCRACHAWIHTHIAEAREKGWLIYKY